MFCGLHTNSIIKVPLDNKVGLDPMSSMAIDNPHSTTIVVVILTVKVVNPYSPLCLLVAQSNLNQSPLKLLL